MPNWPCAKCASCTKSNPLSEFLHSLHLDLRSGQKVLRRQTLTLHVVPLLANLMITKVLIASLNSCCHRKDKVTGFKSTHWTHSGWWSSGCPKLQLFQLLQHLHVINCRLISSSAYFPWNMTLKYKMQLSQGSWHKILHSKSRTQCFSNEEFFCLAIFLSKRYTKVPKVVLLTSL